MNTFLHTGGETNAVGGYTIIGTADRPLTRFDLLRACKDITDHLHVGGCFVEGVDLSGIEIVEHKVYFGDMRMRGQILPVALCTKLFFKKQI